MHLSCTSMRATRSDITSTSASLRVIHPRSYPYSSPSMNRPRTQVTQTQPTVKVAQSTIKRLLNQPSKKVAQSTVPKVAQSTVQKGCSINRPKNLLNQPFKKFVQSTAQ